MQGPNTRLSKPGPPVRPHILSLSYTHILSLSHSLSYTRILSLLHTHSFSPTHAFSYILYILHFTFYIFLLFFYVACDMWCSTLYCVWREAIAVQTLTFVLSGRGKCVCRRRTPLVLASCRRREDGRPLPTAGRPIRSSQTSSARTVIQRFERPTSLPLLLALPLIRAGLFQAH